jgi:hypothetical protein
MLTQFQGDGGFDGGVGVGVGVGVGLFKPRQENPTRFITSLYVRAETSMCSLSSTIGETSNPLGLHWDGGSAIPLGREQRWQSVSPIPILESSPEMRGYRGSCFRHICMHLPVKCIVIYL